MKYPHLKFIKTNKLLNIFLKSFFVVLFLLYFFGFSPVGFIFATLNNISNDYEHISFYSNGYFLNQDTDKYYVGWWNASSASGKATLSADDGLLYFNDENSAFYSGGTYDLVFNNFSLPDQYKIDAPKVLEDAKVEIINDVETGSERDIDENNINDVSSTSDTVLDDYNISQDEFEPLLQEGTTSSIKINDEATSSGEVLGDFEEVDIQSRENIIESVASEENQDVKIIETNVEDQSPEVEVIETESLGNIKVDEEIIQEINKESNDLNLTSFMIKEQQFPTIQKPFRFSTKIVLAQEENKSSLNEFGDFKRATINFSLAYTSRSTFNNSENEQADEENINENTNNNLTTKTEGDGIQASSSSEEIISEEENILDGNIENNPSKENSSSTRTVVDKESESLELAPSQQENTPIEKIKEDLPSAPVTATETEEQNLQPQEATVNIEQTTVDVSMFANLKEAKAQSALEGKIDIWYSVDKEQVETASGTVTKNIRWHKLKTIYPETYSNALNGGYLGVDASEIKSWGDIENLAIKLEGKAEDNNDFVFYLDSIWVDVEYDKSENAPEPEDEKLKRWEDSLNFLSNKNVFGINEKGELRFHYTKNGQKKLSAIGEFFGFINYWKDVDLNVSIVSNSGEKISSSLTMIFEDNGEFLIKLPDVGRTLEPGKYKIVFSIDDNSGASEEIITLNHEFSWGVLAFNTDKSIYSPDEESYLQMAVLDDFGHTICDADLSLQITDPSGRLVDLSTGNNQIFLSDDCGPKSITNNPDYFSYYILTELGDYSVKLIAKTKNGIKEIDDVIKVRETSSLDISRTAPTRIYPLSNYIMQINIKAREDYLGNIREYLPVGFKLVSQEIKIINNQERDPFSADYKFEIINIKNSKKLLWQGVDLQKGDELVIKYMFDAPDISPEFYLLGPLETDIFSETRQWQIASDAVSKRVKTVMFLAGTYNGGATVGQNSDTNQTFTAFNFKLAETGVEIKNAYIMFESQYEAYSNGNVYTGYNLAFDTCVDACTPNAFSGTNRLLQDDNSTLSYSETESNKIRLLQDVSNETQLAAYTGGGVKMQAQVGYRLERGVAANSIANAKAILYVTYLYDSDSENVTNTVSYPLDSTNGTDTGSRQASIGVCTRNSNCPLFDYNMNIPEWSGTATTSDRVSQWFKMYGANDGNNANDMNPNINIQTHDVNSATFHLEAQNSGTQGNFGAMYFPNWASSGYTENNAQQVEMYLNSGTNYALGGEVFETYIASSSALTKTRTVTFPLGVISNGNSIALASSAVDIYFPENGSGTGSVNVQSAYFRIITHNQNSAVLNVTVSTKVGTNVLSANTVYAYNGGGTVVKPSYNMIHIIPSADYAELELANAGTPKNILINATQNATTYGGISAELVITYTYTDETSGYLTNVNLYGGQSNVAPTTLATLSTANSVMPELSSKTILAAGLLSSYLNSDSGGVIGAGTIFLLDANLSTSTPSCTPAYRAEPDDINSFSEFYKDVTSAMNTNDNQSYSACYTDDESLTTTDGAKMSGQFIYTYQWDNTPPTGSFNSLVQKTDGTDVVDISIEINDFDAQEVRAKLEYEATSTCAFISPLDPTLDETDLNITADFGDPAIDNASIYQIGTPVAYIVTASGTNSVFFDWIPPSNIEDTYCLRLTANDTMSDQINSATSSVYIDTLKPTAPGALSLFSRTGISLTLGLGATTTETNFREYKIFYKIYDGSDPNENDSVFASSSDANLGNINFNGATTTSIGALVEKTTYSLAIWAYDNYGNRASSSRVDIYTNDAPTSLFNTAVQRTDGTGIVDISIEVDDANNDDTNIVRVNYVLGTTCDFSIPLDPTLDETQSNIYSDFGLPTINNNNSYQIATSGNYILTSPGSNTINFDWLGATDEVSADGLYCLQTIANDSYDNQIIIATSTLILDNISPVTTGNLSVYSIGLASVILSYATSSPATDTNEPTINAYKIFYKQGISGVSEANTEHDNTNLNSYNYNSATSTQISGLLSDTNYVFNIWSYDTFGNKVSASEISVKTNSTLVNESLTFTNATTTNVLLLNGTTEWNFRAEVSETDGWFALNEVILGLADRADGISTFDDLRFKWSQSLQTFSEIGTDANAAATLSPNSTSTCAVNNCIINFKIIFEKSFASSSVDYDAELFSTNDGAKQVENTFPNFYQARFINLEQVHYRWRNDDGGE